MNQRLKNSIFKLSIMIIFFILTAVISNNSYAKSYSIENMNIQATILDDGDVNIKQSITYKFDGSYNGIYITIPCNFSDIQRDEANSELSRDDRIYNGTAVTVNKITDSKGDTYKNANGLYVSNGSKGKYTIEKDKEKYTIKVYSPSNYETKTFTLDYIINDLCVKHNDVGELYYNFIGGKWDVAIKKLNIDIMLPQNESLEDLYAFGHGPYNGVVTIVSKNQVNLKVDNVKRGQYVAARVAFNKDNIKNSTKITSRNELSQIMQEENNIFENKENKRKFTNKILIISIIFFAYWIVLIFIYEKDKKYVASYTGEEELFEKYNPLIAGCIQGSREILARDIIAVILNLIDKKKIKMEIVPSSRYKEPYKYMLEKTNEENMDEIEIYIYRWLFKSNSSVDLAERLKEMPKEEVANKKFKELNKIAKRKLNEIGANMNKVPMTIRVFNVFLFLISLVLVYVHIQYNKFEIYDSNSIYLKVLTLGKLIIILIPVLIGLISIPINLLVATRHRVHKLVRKFTGQKIVTTTATIALLFFIIIFITAIFAKESRFLIVDELLIGISLIIMLTDNLMIKNEAVRIEDFSRLNMLKDKLEDDTLFEDRDIEQIVLWEKYLAYGVAFGVSGKISKRIKEMHIDDDLEHLLESTSLLNYINSGYYDFYVYASLDRRFVRSYNRATETLFSSIGGDGFSGGSGGGFSRRRWIFWRWWKRPEAGGAF